MKRVRGQVENEDVDVAKRDDDPRGEEPARLDEALVRGFESIKAGRFRPAADVLAELRRR